ncbi:hypothetical protein Cflav_PD0874 [Pedosphaera parvula Ellin514]|uniref:Uncharacterized protein n=2 Tax=Pedosphaera TaxID=1032526 RepID=B9XQJ9_PEDPL|nr:hypothetical protein Cflav_PD0874 [Pedosphaera parvula Ellin514]
MFKKLEWSPVFCCVFMLLMLCVSNLFAGNPVTTEALFKQGVQAYAGGEFDQSAEFFRQATTVSPSFGALHNLGNAEWKAGHGGAAILAWEQAQWLSPFSKQTRENLLFARREAQLDAPELTWYEVCSSWLPPDLWIWIAFVSFWLAVALMVLPGALRWRRADWHQGLAVAALALFLLTIPGIIGVHTRTRLGIVLSQEAPLRLTPTSEGQVLVRLHGGEGARLEKQRGKFIFVRTTGGAGWVEGDQLGLISRP